MSIARFLSHSVMVGVLLLGCSACIEEQDIFIPDVPDPLVSLDFQSPLRDFYEVQGIDLQNFVINPNQDEHIESVGKSKFFLPKGLFLNASGVPVTSSVQIQLLEATSKGDQILYNIASAYGSPSYALESAYFLAARSAEGEVLRVDPLKSYEVHLPVASSLAGLAVLKGQWPNARYFDWGLGVGDIRTSEYTLSSNEVIRGIALRANSLFWLGIGRSIGAPGMVTELCVAGTGDYTPQNTSVFFVLEGSDRVIELPWQGSSNNPAFCLGGMPSGERGRLILLSKRPEGVWHFDQRQITVGGVKQIEALEPAVSSLADIREVLDSL
ncbi:MAG: hypothetical protein NWS63_13750 [Saprospiraceae bacterium]|nr:hypothetical protein [Saprospiraceae bacterium]